MCIGGSEKGGEGMQKIVLSELAHRPTGSQPRSQSSAAKQSSSLTCRDALHVQCVYCRQEAVHQMYRLIASP